MYYLDDHKKVSRSFLVECGTSWNVWTYSFVLFRITLWWKSTWVNGVCLNYMLANSEWPFIITLEISFGNGLMRLLNAGYYAYDATHTESNCLSWAYILNISMEVKKGCIYLCLGFYMSIRTTHTVNSNWQNGEFLLFVSLQTILWP